MSACSAKQTLLIMFLLVLQNEHHSLCSAKRTSFIMFCCARPNSNQGPLLFQVKLPAAREKNFLPLTDAVVSLELVKDHLQRCSLCDPA
jgi:hypothetical protein